MKRRDFITRSTLGAAGAGALLNSIAVPAEAETKQAENLAPQNSENFRNVLVDNGPVKEVMLHSQKARSGVAIGGIGAGSAELRKDGIFYNWSIFNNEPRGTGKKFPFPADGMLFFVVRYEEEGKEPRMKVLQIDQGYEVAALPNHTYEFPWLSGVDKIEYSARFPFVNMKFSDPDMPVDIELEAFNPFIPNDIKNSSLPAMIFDFKITSKIDRPVDVQILMSARNGVGYDIEEKIYKTDLQSKPSYKLATMTCAEMDTKASSFGAMSMVSLSSQSTHYLGWENRHPYYEMLLQQKTLANIDDTEGRNMTDAKTGKKKAMTRLFSSLAEARNLKGKDSFNHSFILTWNFPNFYNLGQTSIEGHYYSNFFDSSVAVAEYVMANKNDLTKRSKEFLNNFYESTLDQFVLDQINSHLNTYITSSWLSKKAEFGILEGIAPEMAYAGLATTDVGMYGTVSIASLFPELQKNTMRAHRKLQTKNGEIGHTINKDFSNLLYGVAGVSNRLDLPSQYSFMVMRDFFWTNDKAYLQEMWPSVKKAIDYVLRERDLNGDSLPDMEGIMCSYDNFPMYGNSAYISSQWLAALSAAAEGAKVMNDQESVKKYSALVEKGKKLFEEQLWNGKYYRLYNNQFGKNQGKDEGCLTDQIIGQWAVDMVGLPSLLPKDHVQQAMKSILAMSYRPNFGLRNCSWPEDKIWHPMPKDIWVDQANTCWSGVELAFAAFLIYEGLYQDGLNVIKTVDDRYRKAGMYFDHLEFGGHYYRPMASWGILNAALGMSINQEVFSFDPKIADKKMKIFFAFPGGTAHYIQNETGNSIKVLSGEMKCKKLLLANTNLSNKKIKASVNNKEIIKTSVDAQGKLVLDFKKTLVIPAGQSIAIV